VALDWLPIVAAPVPRKLFPPVPVLIDTGAIFVPKTIPVPDVLHTTWFLAADPGRPPGPKIPIRELTETLGPDSSVIRPLGWSPILPGGGPPKKALPIPRVAEMVGPPTIEPIIAAQQGWTPVLPPRPFLRPSGSTIIEIIKPVVLPDLAPPCVRWSLEGGGQPDLTTESATTPDFINEGLTVCGLILEDLC
jgi:hypothetical protein